MPSILPPPSRLYSNIVRELGAAAADVIRATPDQTVALLDHHEYRSKALGIVVDSSEAQAETLRRLLDELRAEHGAGYFLPFSPTAFVSVDALVDAVRRRHPGAIVLCGDPPEGRALLLATLDALSDPDSALVHALADGCAGLFIVMTADEYVRLRGSLGEADDTLPFFHLRKDEPLFGIRPET